MFAAWDCNNLPSFGVHGSDRNYLVSKLVYANYLGDVSYLLMWGFILPLLSTMDVASSNYDW